MVLSHRIRDRHEAGERAAGREPTPSILAEILHFFGEVEVIFGLWALPLVFAAFVEAFWSSTGSLPAAVKFGVGGALWALVLGWLALAGRGEGGASAATVSGARRRRRGASTHAS